MEAITLHRKESRSTRRYNLPAAQLSHFRKIWKTIETEADSRWTALTRQMDSEVVCNVRSAALLWQESIESRHQVSTILLRLGVNTPDHSRLFRRVGRCLNTDITPHVVRLRSSTCSNMRNLMQQLTRRLFLKNDPGLPGPLRLSFHSVSAWYQKNENSNRPIVILLEDCEALSPKVLQDFVHVTSVHATKLPIIFVFGLASHPAVLHGLLGSLAVSRLRFREVKGPGASGVRRRVLEPLLLPSSRCPLGMGSRVRNFLADAFSHLDLSASNFLQRLRVCFLEHCLRCPSKQLESLASAAIGKPISEKVNQALKTSEWLGKLLHAELRYEAISSGGLSKSEKFQNALMQWLRLSGDKLIASVMDHCISNDEEYVKELRRSVEQIDKQEEQHASGSSQDFLCSGKLSLQQLQAGLKAMNAERRRPAERLRLRLKEYVEFIVEKHCPVLDCALPMFDDVESVRSLLNPAQRVDLQIALTRPSVYLHGDKVDADEATCLSSRLPDLSILYKLHMECPHYINLYDWMQAFSAVVGDKGDANGVPSPSVQARFALGVSELQFLGLVKPTARKTDHVVRLTWGSC